MPLTWRKTVKVILRTSDDKEVISEYETDTPPTENEIVNHGSHQYFVLKTFFIRGTKIVEVKQVMTVG